MMKEFKSKEVPEIKLPENKAYQEIKPERGTTYSDSKNFWENEFKNKNHENTGEVGGEKKSEKIYYDDNGTKYREGNTLEPDTAFEKNGYTYKTDDMGRVISAEGKLQLKDHEGQNKISDSREVVAHGKMADSDHRGHLIADRFNGSGGLENLVPMDGKLNKGDYAKLENTLADAVNAGADVRMKVEPVYNGDSNRPSEFRVSYSIDGDKEVVIFKNGSGE